MKDESLDVQADKKDGQENKSAAEDQSQQSKDY